MKNILVVDDDEALIGAVSESLQFHGYTVSCAHNGWEALAQLEHQLPALILLEIDMPGIDGLEFCARIREDARWAAVPVIFLTTLAELQNKIAAYTVGADDYLNKPFDMRELILRIKAVLRRTKAHNLPEPVDPATGHHLQIGALRLDMHTAIVKTENENIALTPMELHLLRYLMQHANELFSSEQLLQQVWAYPPGTGDPALVRWHIKNLRCKIEPSPEQPRYLHTVPHHGYMLSA